jgi:hypothetical protein
MTTTPLTGSDEELAGILATTYACTRAWEAWGYGTMTEEDFIPAAESVYAGQLTEWRDAAVAAAVTQRLAQLTDLIPGPCPPPDIAGGFDVCPYHPDGTWPCPPTVAAWLVRGLDPDTERSRIIAEIRRREELGGVLLQWRDMAVFAAVAAANSEAQFIPWPLVHAGDLVLVDGVLETVDVISYDPPADEAVQVQFRGWTEVTCMTASRLAAVRRPGIRSEVGNRIDQLIGWAKSGRTEDYYLMDAENVDRMRDDILNVVFGQRAAAPKGEQ